MMTDRILSPRKALRTLHKTPVLLRAILSGVSPTQSRLLEDGPDSWGVLSILRHMRDYEATVLQRVQLMLEQDHPLLPDVTMAPVAEQDQPASQELTVLLADLAQRRQQFLQLLESLSPEQWLRTGVHREQGPGTILDVAINAGLHDIDHLEQLARWLA